MDMPNPSYSQAEVLLVMAIIGLTFAIMIASLFFNRWWRNQSVGLSPYSGRPLRRASQISYFGMERILRFLLEQGGYDNRIFQFSKASFCRETGRVFPESMNFWGALRVNWDFIEKRHKGEYVSWGSLTPDEKLKIINAHDSLEGFQTEVSCPLSSPKMIEPKYVFTKPGPLYVDVNTKVLVGWKVVPDTDFEVLIVQKPKPSYRKI